MRDNELRARYRSFRGRVYAQPTYYEELQKAAERAPLPWRIAPEKELQIIDRYRAMFPDAFVDRRKEMTRAFGDDGIGVFAGWLLLVEATLARLSEFGGIVIAQIKEKFGALTIHVGDPQSREEVRGVIAEAQEASVKICEFCGAPGRNLRQPDGWFKTMCEACRAR